MEGASSNTDAVFHSANFTFHANDPASKEIIDYYEFVDRTDEDTLIQLLNDAVCAVKRIEVGYYTTVVLA